MLFETALAITLISAWTAIIVGWTIVELCKPKTL